MPVWYLIYNTKKRMVIERHAISLYSFDSLYF